jgi:hypothetical protein
MKLGPRLLGRGRKRFWDRQVLKGFGSLVIRMRARDISQCEAEALIPLLRKSPRKDLCFINIAGGAASDNINALFLIQKEDKELLKNRKIEINVLDIDMFGPSFADNCIRALKGSGKPFSDLDISFRHVSYDWNRREGLSELLAERKGWLQLCSSEGGLFEYGSDDAIMRNLDQILIQSVDDILIAGTLLHDMSSIDAGMLAALKITTNIKPRLIGINGLGKILEKNRWMIRSLIEGNPRYLVFTLKKELL